MSSTIPPPRVRYSRRRPRYPRVIALGIVVTALACSGESTNQNQDQSPDAAAGQGQTGGSAGMGESGHDAGPAGVPSGGNYQDAGPIDAAAGQGQGGGSAGTGEAGYAQDGGPDDAAAE